MDWRRLRDAARKTSRTDLPAGSTVKAVGSLAWLSVLAGVVVAALVVPSVAFVATATRSVTHDVVDLPLSFADTGNPQTTSLKASNGQHLAWFYLENRQDVPLADISEEMRTAIVSIEDYRFYDHGALDLQGTVRALVKNTMSDDIVQGGSTLTQQLVKLQLVQQAKTKEQQKAAVEKSAARKIRELKLAINHEKKYSKDQILEQYLNIAYFGDGAYGINAAAHHYFSKSPAKLNTKQAATLAGLVQNPEEYNPRVYPERALQRRNIVLSVMAKLGKIDKETAEELSAKSLGLKLTTFPNGCVESVASFSCDYVRRFMLADKDLGATVEDRQALLERGGLTIKTNIDLLMQEAVNEAVTTHVAATDNAIGALALVEPGTGKVRALGQSRPMGRSAKKGQSFINFAVPQKYGDSAGFQAGSTFKMFTVAAALKEGIPPSKAYSSPQSMVFPPGTYFDCEKGGTSVFEVKNSTGSGTFNMVQGTRQSVNTYFAQLERDAGLCETVKAAQSMGIKVPFRDKKGNAVAGNGQVPSFTLGPIDVSPLDMAAAYATPASGGYYCKPQPIDEILDSQGQVVKRYEPECKRVMTKENAAIVNEILAGVQRPGGFGYQNGTGLNIPSAAKTGTTNENKAVWYVGYTPEIAAASMIAGINKKGVPASLAGQTLKGRFISFGMAGGSSLAGPQWKTAMGQIQASLTPTPFDKPLVPVVATLPKEKKDKKGKKKSKKDSDD